MLYFFYGDSKKASEKAKTLVDSLVNKKPNSSVFIINEENCNKDTLIEMTQSAGLFQNKYIVRVKNVLGQEEILSFLKELKDSENIFVWNEGDVNKTDLKKIEKYCEKIIELEKTQISNSKSQSSIFTICDPLINRNKKDAWIKYQELLKDFSVEEIHGTIFWQFKNIAITFKSNQTDSGLKPFPYQNAKKAQNKYTVEEVQKKISDLSTILHESRLSGENLEITLENFLLNL